MLIAALFEFPGGAWLLAIGACLVIAAIAVPAYLMHVAGSAVQRRVEGALDERDARRRPTLDS